MMVSYLLQTHDWRSIFYLGTVLTGVLIPAVYFFVPESVHWLVRKQPKGALKKINIAMNRMNFPSVKILPEFANGNEKASVSEIFSKTMLGPTLIMTLAYFLHMTTYYFILKWSPKIVADMGFTLSLAGQVLVCVSIGGATGAAVFGWMTTRIDLKKLTIAILLLTTVFVAIFGMTGADLGQIKLLAAFAGFFGNAAISGLYSILAVAFPTHVRVTGTGFVIGMGRAGAVCSPIFAGVLLQMGAKLPAVALMMGLCSLLGAFALVFLKMQTH